MKPGDRAALLEWDDHVRAIRRATPVDADEHPRVREDRVARLKGDFKAFCEYYFPHYCQSPFARFHLKQQRLVQENKRGVFVWIMSRALAKTTVHTVMNTIYMMVTGEARTIIVASYNGENATRLLARIKVLLEGNQRLIQDFGQFQGLSGWEASALQTQQGHLLVAVGSGQSPRGLSNEEVRPDLIICDDLDEDEQSRNPERVDNAEQWVRGSLLGTFDITGRARFIMVGNRFAEDMVLKRMYEVADHRMEVNITDAKGNPSWPERHTKKDIAHMEAKMGYNVAQRELHNNPIQEGKTFKREWIQWQPMTNLRQYRAMVAYLDPGFKKTKTADSKAWVLVGFTGDKYHVLKAYVGVASIVEMIGWGYELAAYVSKHGAVAQLWMEEVFLQSLLYDDFAEEAKKRGQPLPLRGDKRKKPEKDARIESISGHFERGNVVFNAAEKENHHMKRLVTQTLNFQPGVKSHKDGPDALEGAIHILHGAAASAGPIVVGQRGRNKHGL